MSIAEEGTRLSVLLYHGPTHLAERPALASSCFDSSRYGRQRAVPAKRACRTAARRHHCGCNVPQCMRSRMARAHKWGGWSAVTLCSTCPCQAVPRWTRTARWQRTDAIYTCASKGGISWVLDPDVGPAWWWQAGAHIAVTVPALQWALPW